jgi:hypothetical protein
MATQHELENVLESLSGVESVLGGMVAGSDGEFLGSYMPDIYESSVLEKFSSKLADMSCALEALGIKQKETVLNFEGLKLVIKSQTNGHLIIMCQSNVSMPLLNLSTNIVYKKISKLLDNDEEDFALNKLGITTNNLTMGIKRSSLQTLEEKPKEIQISKLVINQIESLLADQIGPAAKIVSKKSIKKLGGENHSLCVDKLDEYVSLLASKISNVVKQREFRKQVSHLG